MDDFDRALMKNVGFVASMERLVLALETTSIDWDKVRKVNFEDWHEECRQAAYRERNKS